MKTGFTIHRDNHRLYGSDIVLGQHPKEAMTPERPTINPEDDEVPKVERVNIPNDIKPHRPIIPDHIVDAHQDCTRQFIEGSLLPRMYQDKPLTAVELELMARTHKSMFERLHPQDYSKDFELLPDVGIELLMLGIRLHEKLKHSSDGELAELARLVDKAIEEFKTLMDEDPEELFAT